MPSKILYFKLDETQIGKISTFFKDKQNMRVSVIYHGTGKLRDENNQDV